MKLLAIALSVISFTGLSFSQNINLHDQSNQYDYVIITVEPFVQTCEIFKVHKTNARNFSVLITTKTEILSEFNQSSSVQENIRDFISYAGNNWQNPRPKYFLFAADVDSIPNFAFKSIQSTLDDDTSRSDYYYGISKLGADTTNISYYIGRISARSENELLRYFNKVIAYENDNTIHPWNDNALFLADDRYTPTTYNGDIFEVSAITVSESTPPYINNKYIFESDSSQYFGTTDSIISYINNVGTSSILFMGYGNSTEFTHEGFFTIDDVNSLSNNNTPFFSSFSFKQQFSSDTASSIIDQMLFSNAGALYGIAPVGHIYFGSNQSIFQKIWSELYTDHEAGNILMQIITAANFQNEARKFNVFGDPSILLKYSQIASTEPGPTTLPSSYSISQNYPNPFNPSTRIRYSIPDAGFVSLKVFSVLGKEVTTLVNKQQSPGNYEVAFDGSNLSSGIYFYEIKSGNFLQTRKMILIK